MTLSERLSSRKERPRKALSWYNSKASRTWSDVAGEFGYKDELSAERSVRKFAKGASMRVRTATPRFRRRSIPGKSALRNMQMIRDWNDGSSWAVIGAKFGVEPSAAMMAARRMAKLIGVPLRYGNAPKLDVTKKALAWHDHFREVSWETIAKRYDFPCAAAAKRIVSRWAYSSGVAYGKELPVEAT